MKTRLFSTALVIILSTSLAIAQSTDIGRMAFGILGGVNLQNLSGKDGGGDKLENDMIVGYHAGFNVQIPIAPEFYFQPGVLFSVKGAKYTADPLTTTYSLSYIEVPLNLVYKGLLGNGYVMLGFGPYAAYGIMGKEKYEGGSASLESDVEFTNIVEASVLPLTGPYYKAFDAGANIFVGYEMAGGLFFQLNSQLGMLNIKPEDNRLVGADNSIVKNTGFGFSLGYRF